MAIFSGKNTVVILGTTTVSAFVSQVTLNREVDAVEIVRVDVGAVDAAILDDAAIRGVGDHAAEAAIRTGNELAARRERVAFPVAMRQLAAGQQDGRHGGPPR